MLKTNQTKKGFTIIEVVLVLAIAGLIFLMVFIALPALQRNQRDTQRRQDYGDLSSAITQYSASNGRLPKANADLDESKYINKDGTNPKGTEYEIVVVELKSGNFDGGGTYKIGTTTTSNNVNLSSQADANPDKVYVVTQSECKDAVNGDGFTIPSHNPSKRAFSVYGYLESGTYCNSSS